MRRLTPALIVAAAALMQPAVAFADCPPGAWFCESGPDNVQVAPSEEEEEALPPPPQAVEVLPEEEELPPARPATRPSRQPPVVIYQPGQPAPQVQQAPARTQIIIIAPGARTHVVRRHHPAVRVAPPPAPPPPAYTTTAPARLRTPLAAPAKRRWQSEWGLNLRLQGLSMGGDRSRDNGEQSAHPDAGMGGFGLALRYRPVPAFAVEGSFDIIGGTDFNGFDRVETPFSLNGILYLNPRSRAQFYLTGGVHWSSASVTSEDADPRLSPNPDGNNFSAEYKYFGGQGGIGLEFRVSRRLALNVDALAFIRQRTDDGAETGPAEFVNDRTGQTTNTSGGGLFRGGMTFWW